MDDTSFPGKANDYSFIEKFLIEGPGDLVAVCEHRLNERQIHAVTAKLRRHNLTAICNPAGAEPERGVGLTGGVGLIWAKAPAVGALTGGLV